MVGPSALGLGVEDEGFATLSKLTLIFTLTLITTLISTLTLTHTLPLTSPSPLTSHLSPLTPTLGSSST